MNSVLNQMRKGFKKIININREKIILNRFPAKVDPITGETILDISKTKTTHQIYCRITHERAQVPVERETPAGLSTNLNRMIMSDFNNIFYENDTFEYINKKWEIGPVDTIMQFGGIIGYQAPIIEAKE